jgi:diguanylate cyclase (GGDEF)-like protein
MRWRGGLSAEPMIVSMTRELNAIREKELEKTLAALPDLTERQRSLDEIRRLSHTDMLTGLPNRRDFAATLSARLAAAATHGRGAALLIVNLDRFRTVDESLGTAAADRVLVETARRLRRIVEPDDLLARLSGDEFALALWDADAAHAESAARRVLAALAPAYEGAGTRFSITASVGIALAPTDGDELEVLLRSAAAAMRRAKDAGRATVRFHQPRRNVDLRERLELDHAMRQGLPAGHFRIEVQPQFDLASGALAGVEALARWRDPQLGEIGPGRFIPVAEDSGFIVELGQWVLDEAVRCAASWWRCGAPVPIAVNVSALQFRRPDFVARGARGLDAAGLPARGLELELTESILVGEGCEALPRLQELAALGVTLALDDFGTGYSNLSVLKRLPISRLKIDRSFVAALPDAGSDAAIVDAISAMARALRMTVVAEGVETEAQRAFLHRVGCQVMQGYLKARPLPVADFVARWQAGEWVAAGPAGDAATLAVPAPRVLGSGASARAGHSVQVRRRSPGRRLGLMPRV